ncbi:MAG: hypothetical protein HYT40_02180 [Candidatus Sungbacteria bacterium]|uniref:Uncharacterized protein n=1 Tax=Candidatus Sungiibacteriota bacterium TaxID=2750080 RepID=A0A931WN46_9BACT|nr:hypothetical protein [Candidatus Sungbacteria bacterium]
MQTSLNRGAMLMALGALAFIGYGIVFIFRSFAGGGFELGVDTLGGLSKEGLEAYNPAVGAYITHLHVAVSGFIIATGIAVAALSWYGVRRGYWWAWIGAVLAPVAGLAIAIPLHYGGKFDYGITHLGPVYLATFIFVIGALISLRGVRRTQM